MKQYPSLLIDARIQSAIDDRITLLSEESEASESLHGFAITALQLQHRTNDPDKVVVFRNGSFKRDTQDDILIASKQ